MTDTDPSLANGSAANHAAALRAVLRENMAELIVVIDALAPAELDHQLSEEEWTVREILLHVIHAERWMQPQMLDLRRSVAPMLPMPPSDPVTLPDPTAMPDLSELRWGMGAVREETERLLNGLTPAQLREPAMLGDDEDAVDISFRTLLLTLADHQLFHVRQIQHTLGGR